MGQDGRADHGRAFAEASGSKASAARNLGRQNPRRISDSRLTFSFRPVRRRTSKRKIKTESSSRPACNRMPDTKRKPAISWGWPSKMKRGWTASESKHRRCQTAIYSLANSALAGRKHGNQLHRSLEWRLREIGKGENTAVGRTMRSGHVPRTTYNALFSSK